MADFQNDIRLAVDSGKTELGFRRVVKSILSTKAKLVVVATKNKPESLQEVMHLAKLAGTKLMTFEGNGMELGAVCGMPFSVSMLAILDAGNSNILNQQHE